MHGEPVRALTWLRTVTEDELGSSSMVYIHGAFAHAADAQTLADYFAPRGYNVHSFDLRGHGVAGNGKPPHLRSYDDYVKDADNFYKQMASNENDLPVLVGHSMGGLIVTAMLNDHPMEIPVAVLSSPWFRLVDEPPALLKGVLRIVNRIAPKLVAGNKIRFSDLTHDPEILSRHQQDAEQGLRSAKMTVGMIARILALQRKMMKSIGTLNTPLLYLQAESDKIVSAPYARKVFDKIGSSHKRYVEYERFYHEIFNEVEREIPLADVERFLNELWTGR